MFSHREAIGIVCGMIRYWLGSAGRKLDRFRKAKSQSSMNCSGFSKFGGPSQI
ncbi:hypothetical protein VCR5J5_170087 [Vibrio crassostreae]|uniref:Uncharacterized protein n=1 Tax=Vibrio crassostreae TaxID=246167 RepID=A0A822MRN0_9VIBR|nr:hypothetical protein VCR5J5_170087 [Vibrio crassostreae]